MMENKKKMDDYNWPDLYRQADKFMRQYIPETMIHTSMRSLFDGRPAVTVHFPAKGHKQELDLLQKKACFRCIRGTTVNGVRLVMPISILPQMDQEYMEKRKKPSNKMIYGGREIGYEY